MVIHSVLLIQHIQYKDLHACQAILGVGGAPRPSSLANIHKKSQSHCKSWGLCPLKDLENASHLIISTVMC